VVNLLGTTGPSSST